MDQGSCDRAPSSPCIRPHEGQGHVPVLGRRRGGRRGLLDGTCDVSQFAGRFESEPRFEEVRVETLDGIIDEKVDYLSLDVEGQDPLVLDGGMETVKNARLVEFEYHFRGAWTQPGDAQGSHGAV